MEFYPGMSIENKLIAFDEHIEWLRRYQANRNAYYNDQVRFLEAEKQKAIDDEKRREAKKALPR